MACGKDLWVSETSNCCHQIQEQNQRWKGDIGRKWNKIETKEEIKGNREWRQKWSRHHMRVILNNQSRVFDTTLYFQDTQRRKKVVLSQNLKHLQKKCMARLNIVICGSIRGHYWISDLWFLFCYTVQIQMLTSVFVMSWFFSAFLYSEPLLVSFTGLVYLPVPRYAHWKLV